MTFTKNKPMNNNIRKPVYPILEECAQFTLDPYWKQVFEDCAFGRFPKGAIVNTKGKSIHIHGRDFLYVINKQGPEKVYTELKKIFHEQLGLRSAQDKQIIRDEMDDICRDLQVTYSEGWNKIKRKKIKDPLIRKYILDLKSTYQLDDRETATVSQLLKLGFLFNWIPTEAVIYENQQIIDITTLHFDEEERIFELDEPDINYKREYKPKRISLAAMWKKYIEQPKNRYII